jgi:alkanesulfonate monooxygenase
VAIEFIGSLVDRGPGLAADPDYPTRVADLHEEAGFDRLLVDCPAGSADPFAVANQVLTTTSGLGVLLAHRPGFVAPTVAARQFATLEAFHPGRVAMLVIADGDDADRRDGGAGGRGAAGRAGEFLDVVRLEWSSAEPFDYDGEFYRVAGGQSAVRPPGGGLPVYVSGTSAGAVRAGARHADVYALWDQPPARLAGRMATVRAAAAVHGRAPRFSASLRPPAASAGQLAGTLLDYLALGMSTVLIRGYDPEADAAYYAPLLRRVRDQAGQDHVAVA